MKLPHLEHKCGKEHFCNEKCYLQKISRNCEGDCCLKYNHQGEHKCNLKFCEHICNKNCTISKECKRPCILIANHSGSCLCGECKCPETCKLKDCARQCNIKCQFNAGHQEDYHLCNAEAHYCKEPCMYKNISTNCEGDGFCKYEYSDDPEKKHDHVCKQNKHICNGECIYKEKAKKCEIKCSLEAGHTGDHKCALAFHTCKEKCHLASESRNCKEDCNYSAGHEGEHICSLNKEDHLCNKECHLKEFSREGCNNKCSLSINHKGECICDNSPEKHLCNKSCHLFDKTRQCKELCNLQAKHEGEHLCEIEKENHLCKQECFLKEKTRTFEGKQCLIYCCFKYGHSGNHMCSEKEIHICNNTCYLKDISPNCKELCNLYYGHDENLEHNCSIEHLCNKSCFYPLLLTKDKYINMKFLANCNKKCGEKYGHDGECICKQPHSHPCYKQCFFYGKSDGCNTECNKQYGHEGNCMCSVNRENHTCKKECQLYDLCGKKCSGKCGHIFGHEKNENNALKCQKCNNELCKLKNSGEEETHLCGSIHPCYRECEEDGWCNIESGSIREELDECQYQTNFGDIINYRIRKYQKREKKKCAEFIPSNEINHEGKHSCKLEEHKCGFQCKQCEYYCIKEKGHENDNNIIIGNNNENHIENNKLHNCQHGNIKHSNIYVTDVSNINIGQSFAAIQKENRIYKFGEGESMKVFFCDQYCREQGQGHVHFFESNVEIDNNDQIRLHKHDQNQNSYIYECKCSYFWKNVLQFKSYNITDDEQKKFNLCSWKCQYSTHQTPKYCQLSLWHEPTNIIPQGVHGTWVSKEGHVFDCIHPIGIYTIFLLDSSGSMSSKSQKPNMDVIRRKMDNMLGAAIQAIDTYCRLRAQESQKDKCALFGFNKEAYDVFTDIDVERNDTILINCFSKLSADGYTKFKPAFEKAFNFIRNPNFDRNKYIPVIILLTDGLDHGFEETIPYVREVNNFFIILLYFILL